MEKFYIESLGCSKNQIDSEKIAAVLEEAGYGYTTVPEEADYIIVNTCGFIKTAKEEAIEIILEYAEIKNRGKCRKLIVAGCLAQRYADELKEEIDTIDAIFGIGDLRQIVNVIKKDRKIYIPEFTPDTLIKRRILSYPGSAYLRISDGCSNFCSYCAIPYIRGELRSRDIYEILEEFSFLQQEDIREIVLIAQDTTNYGLDIHGTKKLGDLVTQLDKLLKDEERWLRVLYMHPDHIDKQLLQSLKDAEHFVPYFDIPFQSASTQILEQMGRKGSNDTYLKLIDDVRSFFPEAVIRSTFLIGFPGETEEDFKETMDFIEKARLEWAGGFTYSREEQTAAYKIKGHVPERTKKARLKKLLDRAEAISRQQMSRFVGTDQRVLIEEQIEGEDLYLGRIWGQAPEVDGLTVIDCDEADVIGKFITASIKQQNGNDLYAIC